MDLYDELVARGLVKDVSDEPLIRRLLKEKATVYCGFDPSAVSLQLGNFVMISLLRRLQKAGHRIIVVLGGATALIGDPSGKQAERPILPKETVFRNAMKMKAQLSSFLDLSDPKRGLVLNNHDWLKDLDVITFLRDYGKCFPMNYLLSKDLIARRLSTGISYAEFSYSLLQAADFHRLYKTEGCHLQIGGSDQWGNLTSGLELLRKLEDGKAEVGAMTAPLLLDEAGHKFGKSVDGAIYLDPALYSPYRLYQYLINVSDACVIPYLKVFSFQSLDQIAVLADRHKADPGRREAQRALAYELVSMIHGEKKAREAAGMSEALFLGKFQSLSKEALLEVFQSLWQEVPSGLLLEDVLLTIKAAKSKREAREFISGGAIRINDEKVDDPRLLLDETKALHGRYVIIRRGRKNYYPVRFRI